MGNYQAKKFSISTSVAVPEWEEPWVSQSKISVVKNVSVMLNSPNKMYTYFSQSQIKLT